MMRAVSQSSAAALAPNNPSDADIAQAILTLAQQRGHEASFCPSEVARRMTQDWRPLMPRIRAIAATLPIDTLQRGQPVDATTARGPIRLRQRQ